MRVFERGKKEQQLRAHLHLISFYFVQKQNFTLSYKKMNEEKLLFCKEFLLNINYAMSVKFINNEK